MVYDESGIGRVSNVNQQDFGNKNQPHPEILKYYKIKLRSKFRFKTFLASQIDIEISVSDAAAEKYHDTDSVTNFVIYLFENIVFVCQQHVSKGDQMRFILQSPSLNSPIATNMLPADDPDLANVIEFEITKVLQSKDMFSLQGLLIDVLHLSGLGYQGDHQSHVL